MENISIELRKTMAANIERQLELVNKTQREMCQALNFKENTVSDWMNAKTYPRIDKIEMMANYFGCKKSNLIERLSDQSDGRLTIQEQMLLSDFRLLNPVGQNRGSGYIHDLTKITEYTTPSEPEAEPTTKKAASSSA